MKLHFIADAFYGKELRHKKGEIKEVDNSWGEATRWLKRNVAVIYEGVEEAVVEESEEQVEFPVEDQDIEQEEAPKKGRGKGKSKAE